MLTVVRALSSAAEAGDGQHRDQAHSQLHGRLRGQSAGGLGLRAGSGEGPRAQASGCLWARACPTDAGGVSVCLLGSGAPEQPLFLPDPWLPPQLFAQGPRAQRLIQDSQRSPHPWPERWGQSSTRSSQARLGAPPGGNRVSWLRSYTGPREVCLWGGGVGTFRGERNVLFKF